MAHRFEAHRDASRRSSVDGVTGSGEEGRPAPAPSPLEFTVDLDLSLTAFEESSDFPPKLFEVGFACSRTPQAHFSSHLPHTATTYFEFGRQFNVLGRFWRPVNLEHSASGGIQPLQHSSRSPPHPSRSTGGLSESFLPGERPLKYACLTNLTRVPTDLLAAKNNEYCL